ncbi:MAG: MBL fold metallo-hydrolase [Candidatus Lokiarchaeota archaeon]
MIFKRIKSNGLAHFSYFVSSENEAFVVDPRRDCDIYVEMVYNVGSTIKYVFETHRNEDYVIGSKELTQIGDAKIYHGPGLDWEYGNTVNDGQKFEVGNLKVKAIHTPGHTDESMSYVLYDITSGLEPIMVFTGDALFIGDVGRTDMYGPTEARRMASNLYESLFNKILPLGDQAIICPAHGEGSVCGGNISSRELSTIGLERLQNPILQITDKEKFLNYKMEEQHFFSPYFKKMEEYNLKGAPLLRTRKKAKPMLPKEFKNYMENGAIVIDTREPAPFGGAHIKGSYNILLEGIPLWIGMILSYDEDVLLIVDGYKELEIADKYLLRLGYDRIKGYLVGGIVSWYSVSLPTESIPLLTAEDLKKWLENGKDITVLDVRNEDEWRKGHVKGAKNIYIGNLENNVDELSKDKTIVTLCGNGTRASFAASILRRNGFGNVYSVLGSMKAWNKAGYPVVK